MIIYGENPQSNFAAVGFGDFDGAARPYGSDSNPASSALWKPSTVASSSDCSGRVTPASSIDSYISPRANCIQFGVAGINLNDLPDVSADAKTSQIGVGAIPKVEAFLGEGSGPNKRAHVEDKADQTIPRPAPYRPPEQPSHPLPTTAPPPKVQQPFQSQAIPGNSGQPLPQQQASGLVQNHTVPPQLNPGSLSQPPVFPFQANPENSPKQKAKKRVGKRAEPQQLVGLYNESLLKYDSPVSVREVLQHTKVDMTWMDLVAWSPAICRELKRLCTRVPKKRTPKPAAVPQFFPAPMAPMPQMPQVFPQFQPQYQMQAFQPMQVPQYVQQLPGQAPIDNSQSSTQTLNPGSGAITAQCFSVDVGPMTEDKHTKFLSTLIGLEKAFRVPSVVRKPDGTDVEIEKSQSQTDQGSDMNVISQGMVNHL